MAKCPECDAKVELSAKTRLSEVIVCPECTTELEVIGLDPVELALAPELQEDWGE